MTFPALYHEREVYRGAIQLQKTVHIDLDSGHQVAGLLPSVIGAREAQDFPSVVANGHNLPAHGDHGFILDAAQLDARRPEQLTTRSAWPEGWMISHSKLRAGQHTNRSWSGAMDISTHAAGDHGKGKDWHMPLEGLVVPLRADTLIQA